LRSRVSDGPSTRVEASSTPLARLEGPDLAAEPRAEAQHGLAAEVADARRALAHGLLELPLDLVLAADINGFDLPSQLGRVELRLLRPNVRAVGVGRAAPFER